MSIATLFTIAKTWKQPKCPTDEWIKEDVLYIPNGILLGHKKAWSNAICSKMDGPLEIIILSEVSQTEIQISYDIMYMWNLKIKLVN